VIDDKFEVFQNAWIVNGSHSLDSKIFSRAKCRTQNYSAKFITLEENNINIFAYQNLDRNSKWAT